MERDAEHGGRRWAFLLALVAAVVLGTGLLLVARGFVDQAEVTAAPGAGRAGPGTTGDLPAPGATTDPQAPVPDGPDTATTGPEPSAGVEPGAVGGPADRTAAGAAAPASPGAPLPGGAGTTAGAEAAGDPSTTGGAEAEGLPYGTPAGERAAAAQAPGELARTGPPAWALVGLALTAAALALTRVAGTAETPPRR